MKIVKGIQEGRIVLNPKKEKKASSYLMWEDDGNTVAPNHKGVAVLEKQSLSLLPNYIVNPTYHPTHDARTKL
jgi:hypothetical protein